MPNVPRIAHVRPAGGINLLAEFTDGSARMYDCAQVLHLPGFHILKNPSVFALVRVDIGGYGISWTDDVDISEYELYNHGIDVGAPHRIII